MAQIKVTEDCTVCKICIRSCPALILNVESDRSHQQLIIEDQSKCLFCRACEFLCPHDAIYVDVY